MKKKSPVFRGLAAMMGVIMLISMSITTLTLGHTTWINGNLNIAESVTVGGSEDTYAVYWANEYGYDDSALMAVYKDGVKAMEEIAGEGITLMKNENGALPLAANARITLFGYESVGTTITNSDKVTSSIFMQEENISYLDAMLDEFGADNVNTILCDEVYGGDSESANTGGMGMGMSMGGGGSTSSSGESEISKVVEHESTWQNDYNDAAVVVFSRYGSEGNDLYQYSSKETYEDGTARRHLDLSVNEEALMAYLYEQKQAGVFDSIIVILGTEFTMELGFLEEYGVDACLVTGEMGGFGAPALAKILTGKINPSGRTVDTYAANAVSAPAVVNAGHEGTSTWGNADELNDYETISNDANVDYYVVYAEGIYVGYKYYETRYEDVVMGRGNANSTVGAFASTGGWNYAEEMCYPFGHGLSYTTFEQVLDEVTFDEETKTYTVKVTVTNTGDVAGKDVVQVYAQTPYGEYEKENLVEKSAVQLINYGKTKLLQPGESQTLEIKCMEYFLASYDTYGAGTYILSAGDYYFAIGANCHDALNNILAAKGYTTANGMDYNGDASKIHTWNQATLDAETYATSVYTGNNIANAFDNADLNYYEGYECTYITRNDWEGTWPERMQLDATVEMMDALHNYYYDAEADQHPDISVDSFTQGVDSGLTLVDMIGVDFDDPLWETFLNQLTIEQICNTMADSKAVNTISELDIPGTCRGDDDKSAAGGALRFVSHPLTARTWNHEMSSLRGLFEGLICTLNGKEEIWYGAANMHRTPYGGRTNQYWSEDAMQDYWNGYYECEAAQSVGCTICVKHMCANDQETQRTGLSTFLNEQSLREIYLRAFEGSFQGGALSVMCSLGRLGTLLAKNNTAMLTTVLRGEWGFKGTVTSDGYVDTGYFNNALECLEAGMDYSCSDSSGSIASRIQKAIDNGDGYALQLMRQAAKRNLYVWAQTAAMNGLGNGAKTIAIVPAWEMAVFVVNIVIVVLFVAMLALAVWEYTRPKKTVFVVTESKEAR